MEVFFRIDTVPESEVVLPATISNNVVFPEPFGPMMAIRSLALTFIETPAKRVLAPNDLERLEMVSILN